jgi:hypothetical protein
MLNTYLQKINNDKNDKREVSILELEKIESYCSYKNFYSIKSQNKLYVVSLRDNNFSIDTFSVNFPDHFHCIGIMGVDHNNIFYKIYCYDQNQVFLNSYDEYCLVVNLTTKKTIMFDL